MSKAGKNLCQQYTTNSSQEVRCYLPSNTHTQTSPTGRKASQLQQVIHLKYHFLVTIKPRGLKIQKILPEQLAGAEILPEGDCSNDGRTDK